MWQQNYEPVGASLALSALVAAIPIVVLFVMLGVRRKPAWMAALTALAIAFVLALFAYGMPVQLALMSALTGAAYGVFPIAWIVFSSISSSPVSSGSSRCCSPMCFRSWCRCYRRNRPGRTTQHMRVLERRRLVRSRRSVR